MINLHFMMRTKYITPVLLLFAFLSQWAFAQQDTVWQADFWVEHPAGHTDTITLGAAENGGWGLQPGLHETIDTNFATPISILSYDSIVYEQYNTCPGNMQRNMMGFEQTVNYAFYVKSDSFPWVRDSLGFPIVDSVVSLYFDTSQLSFKNEKWLLNGISIESEGGYMKAIDGDDFWLKSSNDFNYYLLGGIPLLYEETTEDYYGVKCGSPSGVIKFYLHVQFSRLTSTKSPSSLSSPIDFQHYVTKKAIRLRFPSRLSGNLQITDLTGRVLKKQSFTTTRRTGLTYNLQTGLYLATVQVNDQIVTFKFFVPKN